jgi:hypothetical protein
MRFETLWLRDNVSAQPACKGVRLQAGAVSRWAAAVEHLEQAQTAALEAAKERGVRTNARESHANGLMTLERRVTIVYRHLAARNETP